MTDERNDYGFPSFPAWLYGDKWTPKEIEEMRIHRLTAPPVMFRFNRIPRIPTKLERAQAYAADVRTRRNMVVCRLTPAGDA